ncbi:MAG: hypothetical protein J6N45_02865 [Alphaproteobacteria bacterium]|nr:hypothetical protein [Alphaproteobacteria bacterium]
MKTLRKTALTILMVMALGVHNALAAIALPVYDGPDLAQKVQQTLLDTIMSELRSLANQMLSKKLTDLGFGEMAGNVFGPVLGPMIENNPYLKQLEGSLGNLEDAAKDMAKGSGECFAEAQKAQMEATKKAKAECKEKNPEDKAAEQKCIEDAKVKIKQVKKDALKLCKEEMHKKAAEISATAKKQAKDIGDSMKSEYKQKIQNVKDAGKDIKNTVKDVGKDIKSKVDSFNWGKKKKDSSGDNNSANEGQEA